MAGMPKPRAMIAVCEVHPPASEAMARTCEKSSSAAAEGNSSSATMMASSVRRRDCASPLKATSKRRVTSSMSELRSRR
jgi:hypothetical protein